MKKRQSAAVLAAALMLFNSAGVYAADPVDNAGESTDEISAYAYENTVEYAVTGGTVSFDKDTGEIYNASDNVTKLRSKFFLYLERF
ncbi:MAG: hypothetical protein IJR59_01560 [Firmicutes bacterium]|nr:hypothetical protein [Bacillota bacterium]